MTLFGALRRDAAAWLRQPWVLLAGVVAVLQFAVLWVLSAQGSWGTASPPRARHALAPASDPAGGLGPWLWLMHPGIMLAPTPEDFSAGAWMRGPGMVVEFESVKRTDQPLPFEPLARAAAHEGTDSRAGAAHAWTWDLPVLALPTPQVAALPFRPASVASLVQSAPGLAFRGPPVLPQAPAGTAPDTLVLRLTLDRTGAVAAPPVVWESSGDPALDLELVTRALGWTFEGVEAAALGDGVLPVFVRVDWGVPPTARPGATP